MDFCTGNGHHWTVLARGKLDTYIELGESPLQDEVVYGEAVDAACSGLAYSLSRVIGTGKSRGSLVSAFYALFFRQIYSLPLRRSMQHCFVYLSLSLGSGLHDLEHAL